MFNQRSYDLLTEAIHKYAPMCNRLTREILNIDPLQLVTLKMQMHIETEIKREEERENYK